MTILSQPLERVRLFLVGPHLGAILMVGCNTNVAHPQDGQMHVLVLYATWPLVLYVL